MKKIWGFGNFFPFVWRSFHYLFSLKHKSDHNSRKLFNYSRNNCVIFTTYFSFEIQSAKKSRQNKNKWTQSKSDCSILSFKKALEIRKPISWRSDRYFSSFVLSSVSLVLSLAVSKSVCHSIVLPKIAILISTFQFSVIFFEWSLMKNTIHYYSLLIFWIT